MFCPAHSQRARDLGDARGRTGRGGAARWRASTSRPLAGSSASAPFASSSFRNCWVSASSEARNSSGLTCGWVEASGTVEPSLSPRRALRPRVELDDHVVQAGLRAQQQRGVGVDQRRVLVVDLHAHHRVAILEVHAGDLADLDPGDVHGLALTRRYGLRGRELRLEVEATASDQRHPARQVGALVDQDHRHREQPGQDQADDGQDVARGVPSLRASWVRGRVGRSLSRQRAVQVRDRVVLTGDVGAERQASSRWTGGCRSAAWCVPPQRASFWKPPPGTGERRFGTGPPGGAGPPAEKNRSDGPLPSKLPALPREPRRRVAELLEVRHVRVEVVTGARVVEDDVAGRQEHVVDAPAQQADLGEEPSAVGGGLARARASRPELAGDVAQLVLAEQRCGLVDPRLRDGDRRRELLDAGRQVAGEGPQVRAGWRWCGGATARRPRGSGRAA